MIVGWTVNFANLCIPDFQIPQPCVVKFSPTSLRSLHSLHACPLHSGHPPNIRPSRPRLLRRPPAPRDADARAHPQARDRPVRRRARGDARHSPPACHCRPPRHVHGWHLRSDQALRAPPRAHRRQYGLGPVRRRRGIGHAVRPVDGRPAVLFRAGNAHLYAVPSQLSRAGTVAVHRADGRVPHVLGSV